MSIRKMNLSGGLKKSCIEHSRNQEKESNDKILPDIDGQGQPAYDIMYSMYHV